MKTVTLILPLEATTVNNPSNSSGVIAGAIEEAAEQQQNDERQITEQ